MHQESEVISMKRRMYTNGLDASCLPAAVGNLVSAAFAGPLASSRVV